MSAKTENLTIPKKKLEDLFSCETDEVDPMNIAESYGSDGTSSNLERNTEPEVGKEPNNGYFVLVRFSNQFFRRENCTYKIDNEVYQISYLKSGEKQSILVPLRRYFHIARQ